MKHTCLLFDLDRTLWDLDKNAELGLFEIHEKHNLKDWGIDKTVLVERFLFHNEWVWEQFRLGKMNKQGLRTTRFIRLLKDFSIKNNKLATALSVDFTRITPRKKQLLPGALDLLNYLKGRYRMAIITNGFNEVQKIKLKTSGIASYFELMVSSDLCGKPKPHPVIFNYALEQLKVDHKDCLMIGDDWEADVVGALNSGIQAIYYNRIGKSDVPSSILQIQHLEELIKCL